MMCKLIFIVRKKIDWAKTTSNMWNCMSFCNKFYLFKLRHSTQGYKQFKSMLMSFMATWKLRPWVKQIVKWHVLGTRQMTNSATSVSGCYKQLLITIFSDQGNTTSSQVGQFLLKRILRFRENKRRSTNKNSQLIEKNLTYL